MKKTNSNDDNVPSFARGTASSQARQESNFTEKASSKTPISSRPSSRISIRPRSSASARPVSRNKGYSRGMAGRKLGRLDEVEDEVEKKKKKKKLFRKGLQRIEEESSKFNIPQIGKGKGKVVPVPTSTITPASISHAKVNNANASATANADNELPAKTVILDDDICDIVSNTDSSERSFFTAYEYAGSDSERSFHTALEWPVSESDEEMERHAAWAFMESRIICEHWDANMEIREEIEMLRISAGGKV